LLHSPSEKRYRYDQQDESLSARRYSPGLKGKMTRVNLMNTDQSQKRLPPAQQASLQKGGAIYNVHPSARPAYLSQNEKQKIRESVRVQLV